MHALTSIQFSLIAANRCQRKKTKKNKTHTHKYPPMFLKEFCGPCFFLSCFVYVSRQRWSSIFPFQSVQERIAPYPVQAHHERVVVQGSHSHCSRMSMRTDFPYKRFVGFLTGQLSQKFQKRSFKSTSLFIFPTMSSSKKTE